MVIKKIAKKRKAIGSKKTSSRPFKKNQPKKKVRKKNISKKDKKKFPTLNFRSETDIAMDFAVKASQKFNKIVKSIILFGSTTKKTRVAGSDIDIIIIIDDASIQWDQELIAWYREELEKVLRENPYKQNLHINTVKLSTWWEDLMRGDPIVLNILRDGEAMIDFAGFFNPLKALLLQGKINATPEAIYSSLQKAPAHIARSRTAELNSIEGLYWAMVDSAHAALMAAKISPPSPEHIPEELNENFVLKGKLKLKYVQWYRDLLLLHKRISHGEITTLRGVEIDDWQDKTEDFLLTMAELIKDII